MKKGDKVKIYHDPFTKKDLEGEAILIRQLEIFPDNEYWEVRFIDEPLTTYKRFIFNK